MLIDLFCVLVPRLCSGNLPGILSFHGAIQISLFNRCIHSTNNSFNFKFDSNNLKDVLGNSKIRYFWRSNLQICPETDFSTRFGPGLVKGGLFDRVSCLLQNLSKTFNNL